MDPIEFVIRYHEETKHHFHRYARSADGLDWSNQPDPFRRYDGSPLVALPLAEVDDSPPYEHLFAPGAVKRQPVTPATIGALLECSLGISAWKAFKGARWALRCNPSSGNLHPTEGYVLLDALPGLHDHPGVYHYAPAEHALERRADVPAGVWRALTSALPRGAFFLGLTSILWREAWKYGERAFRYCQHDVGHAIGALRFAAASLGWSLHVLEQVTDEEIERLLGLSRTPWPGPDDREHPDLLAVVDPAGAADGVEVASVQFPSEVIASFECLAWAGRPNRLSPETVTWELVYAVADACRQSGLGAGYRESSKSVCSAGTTPARSEDIGGALAAASAERAPLTSRHIFRTRRSAVALDGVTALSARQFYLMLHRTVPSPGRPPWDVLSPPATLHLLLFVHRVTDLVPGLYVLVREPEDRTALADGMRPDFAWSRPAGCPPSVPLFHLLEVDARRAATAVSCHQFIAGEGAFSLGMIARFRRTLENLGAWAYRRLFWEAGMIGQLLYLEAEAAGLRGTGIGCYFDDAVHELWGLSGNDWQSMYHFTIGGPVEDERLTTLPAYSRRRAALP